ncbi:MAG TPA: peptidoglycan endopeptidase [Devosiaceae bacterium]|jgi:hypothetical protein|nr:peptidoglycan endopeptidase [Devosiaceae bacterium]
MTAKPSELEQLSVGEGRLSVINALIGRPYRLGAQGPEAFDCYGAARALQAGLFGREMPEFTMPGAAGRSAIAAAIAVHPERGRWREVPRPEDGALVTMARNLCGYHLGTWLREDGGIIVHSIENCGVVADTISTLEAIGWRRFRFHLPAEALPIQ